MGDRWWSPHMPWKMRALQTTTLLERKRPLSFLFTPRVLSVFVSLYIHTQLFLHKISIHPFQPIVIHNYRCVLVAPPHLRHQVAAVMASMGWVDDFWVGQMDRGEDRLLALLPDRATFILWHFLMNQSRVQRAILVCVITFSAERIKLKQKVSVCSKRVLHV